jgi:hypothetical protein
MHRDIIEAELLGKVIDIPDELRGKVLEIFIREYEDDDKEASEMAIKMQKRAQRVAYLGKESEVFFFTKDELPDDRRRKLISKLKECGYQVEHKEGSLKNQIITLAWKNV